MSDFWQWATDPSRFWWNVSFFMSWAFICLAKVRQAQELAKQQTGVSTDPKAS